jgi:hypothetical protein
MPSSPHWKLRRLAPRAKRVQKRRAADSPIIDAYESTLQPKASTYIAAYDDCAKYQNTWRRELLEGKGAVAELVALIRGWLPLLIRDIPGFEPASFGDKPDVPDDVIEDGERLASTIDDYKDLGGVPLSYKDKALNALTPAIAKAAKEWAEAEQADSVYQKLLEQVRSWGEIFDAELQAFRRSLAAVAGRSDKDYQKLRAERASQEDSDDDPGAPPAPIVPPPTPPAP